AWTIEPAIPRLACRRDDPGSTDSNDIDALHVLRERNRLRQAHRLTPVALENRTLLHGKHLMRHTGCMSHASGHAKCVNTERRTTKPKAYRIADGNRKRHQHPLLLPRQTGLPRRNALLLVDGSNGDELLLHAQEGIDDIRVEMAAAIRQDDLHGLCVTP